MSYSVNPTAFKSIFAVPADIVDKHIKLANEHQLKVLLWILRNSPDNPDIDAMCAALKINPDDALDYLQYWIVTGILLEDGVLPEIHQTAASVKAPASKPVAETVKKEHEYVVGHTKPSSSEIAQRIEESPEIGHLINEAQVKLGKTIGYDGQCTLLLLHDHYGLPAEVLFMLIEYCCSIGKTNYSYIETVGKDWGTREIDTLDKAAEQITALKKANMLWRDFAKQAGINTPRPTTAQTSYLRKWSDELKFSNEMIFLAYEEMANHTGKLNFKYIDKVLTSWYEAGVKTPSDLEKYKSKTVIKPETKAKKTTDASYDLDKFSESALHSPIKYERKKKE